MLHEKGYEVHVAARDNLAEKNGLKLDFVEKVYSIPFSRSPKSADNFKAYKQLKKIIESENYDIIHCNTPMGGIVTRLASIKARKNGTKVFYTAHGFHFYKGAPLKNWLVFYPIEKIFARFTDKLITITTEDFNLASRKFRCKVERIHGVGANSSKFFVMKDAEKNELRRNLGIDKDQKIILNVGELLPNKNQKTAIAALALVAKKIPNIKLMIAGNGPEKENLERLIRDNGLENNIVLLGYTTELEKYMNICDVVVACSFREGLPLNVIEAMLCKKPVVASDNRGHRELIINAENGFIMGATDINGFSEKISELALNSELAMQIGDNAKSTAEQYSAESVKKELVRIYEIL